jgi:hypothetical protein
MKQKTSTLIYTTLAGSFCCAGFRFIVVDFEGIESLLAGVSHQCFGERHTWGDSGRVSG